ncbi:hypothetical protein SKAU_G00337380 [Synaphobranchus kaupii]|uniref:Uncharacterized protein n=1 Tax=Synaphobranchus kaupii TaxID=118154 RepID=A0A9Q1IIV1_SYNKA|nr:hypothetical protein SKAU_G00337380 [Synaphobranchus kaupii]
MTLWDTEFGVKGSSIIREWSGQVQPALVASFIFLFCLEACLWVRNLRHKKRLPGPFPWPVMISGGKSMAFTSYSTQWKMHRRIAQSTLRAFSSANSQTKKAFEQHIVGEALDLVQIFLRLSGDGRYFNPSHELTVAAANVICALCFGKRYGHDDIEFKTLLSKVNKFGETVGAGSLVDVMPWLQSFPNPVRSIYKNFKELNEEFFAFVKDKVIQHRETYNPEVTRDMSDAIISVIEHGKENGLSKDFVEGTVTDLIGAGQDTVSTFLQWILLLLVKYPHIQTKIQEQIDKVVGRDRLPSVEDKSSLVYLDAFIYETMRFTSFVPVTIPHSTTSDVTIDGVHIPRDTVVFINQWSVNHDPQKWKDPHIFNPSRFLDENGVLDKDLTSSVMIFSIGKRRCIGDQIAKYLRQDTTTSQRSSLAYINKCTCEKTSTMALWDTEFGVKGSSIIREWSGQVQPALVATLIFLFCLEACLWVRNLRHKRRLPGPFPWPVVGNAMQLGQMPHITFFNMAKKYGNVYQIRLGCNDIVVLNGDTAIHQALIQHSTEFAGRPNFISFQAVSGGKSISFGNYSTQWKLHRRIAQSTLRAFSSANSQTKKAFEQHIVGEALDLVQVFLRLSADGRYFNPSHELTVAAANVICALCFGKRYGHDDIEFKTLLSRVEKFGETVGAGSLVDVMPWLQSFPNPVRSIYRNFKELNKEYFAFIKDNVIQHRETYNPEVTRDMSDAIIRVIDKADNATGLTKAHTEGTVADLIGAGLDTVSTALHWMLLLLVKYPHIQTKLQEQIDKVVGRDRLPSTEDKSSLAYLDAFIYETMRFTTFVPFTIPHSTTSDVTIDGVHIPRDTVVFINQWSVNHDPQKWKDPHVFNPSRFLNENGILDKDLTSSVMIFSMGKRRCIGDQIAKAEIFLYSAILLHQCSFENSPTQDLTMDCSYGLTLRPLSFTISAKLRGKILNGA